MAEPASMSSHLLANEDEAGKVRPQDSGKGCDGDGMAPGMSIQVAGSDMPARRGVGPGAAAGAASVEGNADEEGDVGMQATASGDSGDGDESSDGSSGGESADVVTLDAERRPPHIPTAPAFGNTDFGKPERLSGTVLDGIEAEDAERQKMEQGRVMRKSLCWGLSVLLAVAFVALGGVVYTTSGSTACAEDEAADGGGQARRLAGCSGGKSIVKAKRGLDPKTERAEIVKNFAELPPSPTASEDQDEMEPEEWEILNWIVRDLKGIRFVAESLPEELPKQGVTGEPGKEDQIWDLVSFVRDSKMQAKMQAKNKKKPQSSNKVPQVGPPPLPGKDYYYYLGKVRKVDVSSRVSALGQLVYAIPHVLDIKEDHGNSLIVVRRFYIKDGHDEKEYSHHWWSTLKKILDGAETSKGTSLNDEDMVKMVKMIFPFEMLDQMDAATMKALLIPHIASLAKATLPAEYKETPLKMKGYKEGRAGLRITQVTFFSGKSKGKKRERKSKK